MQPKIIENFISSSLCYVLNNYFKSRAHKDQNGYLSVPLTSKEKTFGYHHNDGLEGEIFSEIVRILISSIAHEFNIPKSKISLNRVNYQILTEGQEVGYHSDNRGAYQGQMKNTGRSALLYLNKDYTGGEIAFYDKDINGYENKIEYRPNPGTLIYFVGDEDHPHSVNPVISGERANLVLFYDVDQS